MGAYGRYVYILKGEYYGYDQFEAENDQNQIPEGPFSSLPDAIVGCGFHHVSSASNSIHSDELSRDELLALLKADSTYRGDIRVNGKVWDGRA